MLETQTVLMPTEQHEGQYVQLYVKGVAIQLELCCAAGQVALGGGDIHGM